MQLILMLLDFGCWKSSQLPGSSEKGQTLRLMLKPLASGLLQVVHHNQVFHFTSACFFLTFRVLFCFLRHSFSSFFPISTIFSLWVWGSCLPRRLSLILPYRLCGLFLLDSIFSLPHAHIPFYCNLVYNIFFYNQL